MTEEPKLHQEMTALSSGERTLLDLIWREGPISRKELAEKAGVTGASTTRLTRRLGALGLVEESVHRGGGVGSPSRPLNRAPAGAFSVGVSLERREIRACVADLSGRLLARAARPAETVRIDEVEAVVREAVAASRLARKDSHRILGVGLAVPGYRAVASGRWAIHWDFPELFKRDFAAELAERLDLPVHAERDAVAAAWAERLHGAGRTRDNYFLIYLAQGVGGALMLNGRPLLGAHGNAGGAGALFPYADARPTTDDLRARLAAAGVEDVSVDALAPDGPERAVVEAWLDASSPSLRAGVNTIARLYDPDSIVLGGLLPKWILEALLARMAFRGVEADYTDELPSPEVIVAERLDDALLLGAAAAPIARVLA